MNAHEFLRWQIKLGLPTPHGREQILQAHARKLTCVEGAVSEDVDWGRLARSPATANFTGAELESLVICATSYATERLLLGTGNNSSDVRFLLACNFSLIMGGHTCVVGLVALRSFLDSSSD